MSNWDPRPAVSDERGNEPVKSSVGLRLLSSGWAAADSTLKTPHGFPMLAFLVCFNNFLKCAAHCHEERLRERVRTRIQLRKGLPEKAGQWTNLST